MTTPSPRHRLARSFGFALRGIAAMIRDEPNARIHLAATLAVVVAGAGFGIERGEWLAIVLAIGAVWCAEGVNTAFESICDLASPQRDPRVEHAKDVAAGAVLLAALAASAVAILVFGPRIAALLAN